MRIEQLVPGTRVRVRQSIERREGPWIAEVEGEVIEIQDRPTGSWYARGKRDRFGHADRYWLKRLKLRKEDGEITLLALDEGSEVIVLDGKPA